MNAVGYVRVSTTKQEQSGLSFDAQVSALERECEVRDWTLLAVERDTITTRKDWRHRHGLARALEALDAGTFDALVVSRLDRLCRSTLDLAQILEHANIGKWQLVILDPAVDTSTPFGRALLSMAAVFGQLERELTSQRTSEAIQARIASGQSWGRQSAVPDFIVERIVLERSGKRPASFGEIADALNDDEIPAVEGGPWSRSSVYDVYRRAQRAA